ncbi:MAG: fatty acyl-AMP ligase [Bacteroidales bacterium]|nr:fatty acyl-AMP ligase [Bacteroidales bacterium]
MTFNEILLSHARETANKPVYYLLDDNGNETERITYTELLNNLTFQAFQLRQNFKKGDRCLLIFQPGLELIISLLACFYSGIIAVPVNPPKRNKANKRFWSIISDSAPSCILMDQENRDLLEKHFNDSEKINSLEKMVVKKVDLPVNAELLNYGIKQEDIAFLQYTSGSTDRPKGVMVSHQNLMNNSEVIKQSFHHDSSLVVINWLPPFHDMGLIGNLLQPLYVGGCSVIMHPNTFLRKPVIWLQAITKYKGTTTGCPNFALDYCVDKISEEQKRDINFSSLKVMFCGSEQVRKLTLQRFSDAFQEQGFTYQMFLPCYGLAESTLMVSGIAADEIPLTISISQMKAEQESVVELRGDANESFYAVGCGISWNDNQMIIADPETMQQLEEDHIGEIWLKGDSVCRGYWNNPEETNETFRAQLSHDDDENWLRTGDLGFLHEGQVFITGRIKDMIIIRGVNYFPDYIEETIESAHKDLQKDGCAVFSIERENEEKLVVMQELKRTAIRNMDQEEIFESIREAVTREFEIPVFGIQLISPGRLPRTTSGKIQRHLCKKYYE